MGLLNKKEERKAAQMKAAFTPGSGANMPGLSPQVPPEVLPGSKAAVAAQGKKFGTIGSLIGGTGGAILGSLTPVGPIGGAAIGAGLGSGAGQFLGSGSINPGQLAANTATGAVGGAISPMTPGIGGAMAGAHPNVGASLLGQLGAMQGASMLGLNKPVDPAQVPPGTNPGMMTMYEDDPYRQPRVGLFGRIK